MALLVSNCLMIVTIAIIMLCNILSDCVNIPCCTWPNLNQEQSEALKFIYFFFMDCSLAPCTLFLGCDIRQQCYQYILIVPRIDLRIQFTFAMVMLDDQLFAYILSNITFNGSSLWILCIKIFRNTDCFYFNRIFDVFTFSSKSTIISLANCSYWIQINC